ncbi:alpha-amylase family protein [Pseudactinotalea terrae]|uniref:alpha-amylase family protein n=1 Tax=Pseudactinotalea terrae TaxID=1743262 RepID=UPI001390FB83|nr:alpha-amylase family protein [Pseudactinotalea terrae]
MEPWWHRPFRVYQSNIREVDAVLDVPATIEFITSIGANTWLLNAAGIAAFYPSDLEHQYRSPWLAQRPSGDLIGDAVTAAHAAGINVVARLDMSKMMAELADQHPDWQYRDREGNTPLFNGLRTMCPSSPYQQEQLHVVLDELLDRYRLDGIFLNWFHFTEWDYAMHPYGVCHCDNCKRRFAEYSGGKDLPTERDFNDPLYREYKAFNAETMDQISSAIRRTISRRDWPIALVARQDSDIAWSESGGNSVFSTDSVWMHQSGDDVLEFQTSDDREIWHHKGIFVDMRWRFEIDQQGLSGPSSVQAIAHGGNLCTYQNGIPTTIPEGSFEGMAQVMRFHAAHEEHYAGIHPAGRVAVAHASATQTFLGGDWLTKGAGLGRVRDETRGVTAALRRAHIPFVVLPQPNIARLGTEGLRRRYDLLVLPNAAILSDEEAAIIDAFVAEGGNLVATGDTGLRTPDGTEVDEFRLVSLGAHRVSRRRETEEELRGAYLRVLDVEGREAIAPRDLLLLYRRFLQTELRPGAVSGLSFIPPAPFGPPEKIYWSAEHETAISGLVWYQHGAGTTAYFPWPIGWLSYDMNLPGHAEAIVGAVRALSPAQVVTDATPHVEIVIADQAATGRRLMHLINYSGRLSGKAFTDHLPIHDITVSVPDDATAVHSLTTGEALAMEMVDGWSRVTVPTLELFEALVVERS